MRDMEYDRGVAPRPTARGCPSRTPTPRADRRWKSVQHLTDFHPQAVARGWRTEFAQDDAVYYLPTVVHTRQQYLDAVQVAGCAVAHVENLLLRDAPRDSFPAHIDVDRLFAKSGGKTFGLNLLGEKGRAG